MHELQLFTEAKLTGIYDPAQNENSFCDKNNDHEQLTDDIYVSYDYCTFNYHRSLFTVMSSLSVFAGLLTTP